MMISRSAIMFSSALALAGAFLPADVDGAAAQDLKAFEKELVAIADSAMPFCVKVVVTRRAAAPGRTNQEVDISLSGLLLDTEGHVVTLGEALDRPVRVSASLFDGKEERVFRACVVGVEPTSNIGVIRLEGDGPFSAPVLADSSAIKPGSLAIGLAYPFDLGPCPSVSIGNVCARQREFTTGAARYTDLIEVSFVIRPGEPGGILLDSAGEIAGLLLTSYYGSAPAQGVARPFQRPPAGIALAIPINDLKVAVQKILDQRALAAAVSEPDPRPWVGFVAGDLDDPILRNQVKLARGGVIILQVHVGQPAAQAGIEKHDILVKWNDEEVQDLDHLRRLFDEAGVGDCVTAMVIRNGEKIEKKIVIGKD